MSKCNDWVIQEWPQRSGHGMQVPRMSKGIKVTHIPSGLTETCEDFRSQHQNRDECMRRINEKLSRGESQ
jgi:protein subunit release factor A